MSMLEAIVKELPEYKDVISSYTGRVGCMCGCLGKHSYASKHRAFAGKDRGYTIRQEEVSDVAVKRAYNKLGRLLSEGKELTTIYNNNDKVNYVYYDNGNRVCCIYFKC